VEFNPNLESVPLTGSRQKFGSTKRLDEAVATMD
jgi:hypothetical protein